MTRSLAGQRSVTGSRSLITDSRLVTRQFPYSLLQDGSGDYVDMGNNYAFERTDPFTLMGIFNLSTPPASNMRLQSKTIVAGTQGYGLNIDSADQKLRIYLQNGAGNRIIRAVDSIPRAGRTYFYVMSYDGSSDVSGVNMVLVEVGKPLSAFSASTSTQNNLSATMVTTAAFRLGARVDNNLSFKGWYQAMSICTTGLSLAEIQAYYYDNVRPASMASLWLAENTDGAGATLTDEVGAIDGTITGAAWSANSAFALRTLVA